MTVFPASRSTSKPAACQPFCVFGEREHLVVPNLDEVVDFVGGQAHGAFGRAWHCLLFLESQRQLETDRSPKDKEWLGVWVMERDVWS